jgi:hypothetical protein
MLRLKNCLELGQFTDHELPTVQFGVHWETKRLEDTELGASYEVQIEALEDGALGRNVPSSGIPTSQVMAMYEVDLEAGFEALGVRDWQGHLVSRCVRMGSENKEESDDSDSDSEAQRNLGDHQKTQIWMKSTREFDAFMLVSGGSLRFL